MTVSEDFGWLASWSVRVAKLFQPLRFERTSSTDSEPCRHEAAVRLMSGGEGGCCTGAEADYLDETAIRQRPGGLDNDRFNTRSL